eukprot:TRINITY_DN2248_c0_g1_i1.p1 TRINITY_DN2248_c0_g1~~TRINITY_DN2248_c0_g1_i1.p1  ORF type:complete len:283 (+),score=73.46 TRINITY_DN2248_c0_g1_i1:72-851(+)
MSKRKQKVELRSDETDACIAQQKATLAENLQHFMDSIPELNKRYNACLETVKARNPKRAGSQAGPLMKRAGSVKRQRLAEKEKEEEATSPAVTPKKDAPQKAPAKGPQDLPSLPDNRVLLQELANIKHESYELSTILNGVVDWIALSIPQIKDEDNLGVEVQERVLSEISGLLKVSNSSYEAELGYLQSRAESESQYYKHFLAPSWRHVIEAHDLNEWDDLERSWRDMVRVTINAYSVLSKNMEKLKNPRRQPSQVLCM